MATADVVEAETTSVVEDTARVEIVEVETPWLVLDCEGDVSVDCTEVEAWVVCAVVGAEVLTSVEEGGTVEVLSNDTLTGSVLEGATVTTDEVLVLPAPSLFASSTKLSATWAFS